jgi:hypothetical protein
LRNVGTFRYHLDTRGSISSKHHVGTYVGGRSFRLGRLKAMFRARYVIMRRGEQIGRVMEMYDLAEDTAWREIGYL